MPRFVVDESVHGAVTRAILRLRPHADLVRVQDVGLAGADDPTILQWAAEAGRVLLTSDVSTLVGYAYEQVQSGHAMPGVLVVGQGVSLGPVIEDILLIADASTERDWEARIVYLPL